ncbi:MAG: ABC transporter ATP-binding protein [Anaerolineae bacterium]
MTALDIQGLSVWHGRVQAVRRVSLTVGKGEIVALLGANGAGKSSLLAAIAGLHRPAEGTVTLDGAAITGLAAEKIARRGLSLVPEGRQLAGTMSVRDNLLLGGYQHLGARLSDLLLPLPLLRRRPATVGKLADVYALFPRLREREEQLAQSLSGGEQQMLAIGCALMAEPNVLLLDEPSIGLAPELVRAILALLEQLRQRGLAILLVEQDAHGALRVAQRGYVMETGRIVAEGAAEELLQSETLRRAYLGM